MIAPNWVSARANCTLDDNLTSILEQVRKDIRLFNDLRPDKRGKRKFQASFDNGEVVIKRLVEVVNNRGLQVIEDDDHKNDVIVIRCMSNTISVRRNNHLNFEIEPRWNVESQECDLLVDGERYPVWRISEMILGEFLFQDDAE